MLVEIGEDGGKNLQLLMMGCTQGVGWGSKARCQVRIHTKYTVWVVVPLSPRGERLGEDSFGGEDHEYKLGYTRFEVTFRTSSRRPWKRRDAF